MQHYSVQLEQFLPCDTAMLAQSWES